MYLVLPCFAQCMQKKMKVTFGVFDCMCHKCIPKVGFAELFQIERLIAEGGSVQDPFGGEHVPPWLEPLLGMEVGLQHAFVEQHVTHGFRDDHIDLLWNLDLHVTG